MNYNIDDFKADLANGWRHDFTRVRMNKQLEGGFLEPCTAQTHSENVWKSSLKRQGQLRVSKQQELNERKTLVVKVRL